MSAVLNTQIASEWTGGFVANLSLVNDATAINNWTLSFDAGFDITNIWNAQVVSHVGNHFVLQGLYFDASVAPNGVVNFGFQASGAGSASITNQAIGTGGGVSAPSYLTVWNMDIGEPQPGVVGGQETSFSVQLSQPSTTAITVSYATQDGTAKDGLDYVGAAGTLTFLPGETQKTVAISILGDNLVEGNETFSLALGTPSGNGVLRQGVGTATVHDATSPPEFSVGSASVLEPASGTTNAAFTITMSKAAAVPVTLDYATVNGSAQAGSDFAATSGTVTFAPGETTKVVNVTVNADAAAEATESFGLRITNPSLGNVVHDIGTGTITDPGGPLPNLSVADVSLAEPGTGTANASFTVSLSQASAVPVTVNYATVDGTAKAGSDYAAASGTLTFAAGETTKVVNVAVNADALFEGTESFGLALTTPGNAGITRANATATIADGTAPPSFSISDATVAEPTTGTALASFTVTLSKAAAIPLSISYATQDGTAHAGQEYTATSGTLTFAAGETSKVVTVAVLQDMLANGTSSFALNLTNASLGSISHNQGQGSITDSGLTLPGISVGNASVAEPTLGAANASFTISLDKAGSGPVTVSYATVDGTAHAGTDFTAASGSVTFAAGETTKVVNVAVNADALVEGTEGFQLALSGASGGTLVQATGQGTILDGTPAPSFSVSDVSLTEPVSGTANASFTVTMSKAAAIPVTVSYGTADGTALAGSDYAATSGTLTFAAGETSKTVNVAVNADGLAESTESFALTLTNLSIGTLLKASGTATVQDAPVALSIGDVTLTEPSSGTALANFTVTLNKASAQTVTVAYATADGTALAGQDYAATFGTLTFAPGETSKVVGVAVNADALLEGTESFALNLSAASNAVLAKAAGAGSIADSGLSATFSASDASVTEPGSGTTNASFTITLSRALGVPMTVSYATVDGTAHAGTDFTAASGTLTFAAGETTKVVNVAVAADALVEGTEGFGLHLSAPSAGTVAHDGAGTILDGTPAPSISVGTAWLTEPSTGTANASFTVTMSTAAAVPVTVAYTTVDGTALASSDYAATSGTLTFAAGETSKVVTVAVNADTLAESTENFSLQLSSPSLGTLGTATGIATVLDALPGISVADISVTEPATGTTQAVFTVSLSQASAQTVTVNYATADGTAKAASDYTATSGTLTFAPGETSKTVSVAVKADAVVETTEMFALNLTGLTNAVYAKPAATGSILDNTAVASFSVGNAQVSEPASGTVNASFTVTLAQALTSPVTVAYATADGTAKAGSDYTATSGTLTFAAGETSKVVTVAVKADALYEGTEAFTLGLSAPSAGSISQATGTGTILDATPAPSFSITDASVTEPVSGTVNESFTVSLSAAAAVPMTVNYATADGTALAGTDYTATSGTLTFAAGETSKTVTVAVKADALVEGTEAFALNLSAPSAGTLTKASGAGTILDLLPAIAVADATVAEPASGATATQSFTVSLSKASNTPVTVHYATADGTAKAGVDYTATSGTLTFAAGETSKVVAVPVKANANIAGNEQFSLVLSAPTAATLADDTGAGLITYTPPATTLKLTEVVRSEWGQGFVADLTIDNSGPAQGNWTVSFDFTGSTVNVWNAHVVSHVGNHYVLAGESYNSDLPANGHVGFGFQADGASANLTNLKLTAGSSSTSGSLGSGSVGSGTTSGDTGGSTGGSTSDSSGTPSLVAHDTVVAEPTDTVGTATFNVTLSHASAIAVTVDYATVDGSATAGNDYTATHGTLTFAPGVTSQQVTVTVLPDPALTSTETFGLKLSNASGASIADANGTASILDSALSSENPGYLHTDGNQIVNDAGIPVQLNSVSWFGFESANFAAHGLWTRSYEGMMDQMVQLGFNSIRIPYCDQMFDAASKANGIDFSKNPDLVGLSPLEILDKIVAYADKIGLKIVLDHHRNSAGAGSTENGLWYDSKYSEADMIKNWEMLADRYGSNTSVIGADLHNEPHAAATWGTGAATDWDAAAERIGDAVLSHAPNWLIFVEGIGAYNGSTYWWGGDLEGAKAHPVDLSVANRLVYSPHDYPNSIYPQTWFSDPSYPANEPAIFSAKWGYLYEQDIAPLWIGEWGSKLTDPKDVQWADAITKYIHGDTSALKVAAGELGPSWSWWAWNPNSGDTGGILKDDWTTVNLNKIELLQPLMYGLIPTENGAVVHAASNASLGLVDQSFTGASFNDVLFQNADGTTWFWEVENGAITHQGAVAFLDPTWKIIGSGDTDGSGKAEILVQTPAGYFGMWQLDANLQGHYMGSPGSLDASWTALKMKDFNGDGLAEVLFHHTTDDTYWTWKLNGSQVVASTNLGAGPSGSNFAGAGDFNGDGKSDVLWKAADGTLSISFTDGQHFTTTNAVAPQAAGWGVQGVADFTGDGKTDLLMTDGLGHAELWEMAGNIVTQVDDLGAVDPSWTVASVGDLSGDGKADILWRNTSGQLWAWNMDGAHIASQGSVGWVSTDWHVVGA